MEGKGFPGTKWSYPKQKISWSQMKGQSSPHNNLITIGWKMTQSLSNGSKKVISKWDTEWEFKFNPL